MSCVTETLKLVGAFIEKLSNQIIVFQFFGKIEVFQKILSKFHFEPNFWTHHQGKEKLVATSQQSLIT